MANEPTTKPDPARREISTPVNKVVDVPPGKLSPLVYRRLINDGRISHGAHRLWHYFRDRSNKRGQCFPKVRDIAADLHCKPHSLPGWQAELISAGYLRVETRGQNHNHLYTVLGGDGKSALPLWASPKDSESQAAAGHAMPKPATPRVADTGSAKDSACCPLGNAAMPKPATPRVAQMGIVSNTTVVIPIKSSKTNLDNTARLGLNSDGEAPLLKLTPEGQITHDLMLSVKAILGEAEFKANHSRWYDRARQFPGKLQRVLADTRQKHAESQLTNPAAWAEQMWKEFTP